ncbi:MAG: hypothetical protein WD627_01310 [Actinomycetota bacterium]
MPEPMLPVERRAGPRIAESLFVAAIATSSLVSVRLATAVTVTDGLLLACGVLAVLRLLATGTLGASARRIPMPVSWAACVGLVMLGGFLSSIRAVDPPASISITLRLLVVTGLFPLLAWMLLRQEGDLVKAAAALAIAGAIQGLAATLQLGGLESTLFGSPQFGRYTGFAGHPNDLGAALAITLPMSLVSLFLFAKRRFAFVLLGLGFPLTLAGLRLSGSLSAFAGALAGVVVTLVALRKVDRVSRRWVWYGGGLAALILVLVVRYGATLEAGGGFADIKDPRTRLSEVVGGRGTLSTRFRTIKSALEDIAENPLVGRGFDRESTDVFRGRQVHSMPILAWHAGGLLVLTGLFGVIFLSLRIVRPGRAGTTSWRLKVIRAGLLGSTCAMIVNGLAQPFLYKRFGWIPVALIFSRPILQRVTSSMSGKPPGPPGEPDPEVVPDRPYAMNGRSGSG